MMASGREYEREGRGEERRKCTRIGSRGRIPEYEPCFIICGISANHRVINNMCIFTYKILRIEPMVENLIPPSAWHFV